MRTLLALSLAIGCARSIEPSSDDTGSSAEISAGEATIDATSDSDWAYLDLESSSQPEPDNPDDSTAWDLGFRRYKVKINGGVSGTGGMEIVPVYGAEYNDTIEVPDDGWVTDEPDADGDGDLEYAFDTWFEYDSDSHEVTAADVLYVVRTVEENLFKLQFLEYYDSAGTPGYIRLRWGPLDDTVVEDTGDTGDTGDDGLVCSEDSSKFSVTTDEDGVSTITTDTSSEDEWVCWDMSELALVSEAWDMAMLKWTFLISGEAVKLDKTDFDSLTEAPSDGYEADDGTGSNFVDWYNYNSTEHTLDPAGYVYVVHTTDDHYYKIEVLSYYPEGDDSHSQPGHPRLRIAEISAPTRQAGAL